MTTQPNRDQTPLPDYYGVSADQQLTAGPLSEEVSCETVVIGGGISGVSTAYSLAENGRDVVLLEGGEIGNGGSGRAFGQVVAFGKHSEAHLIRKYGPDLGERLIAWLASGPDQVFGLIDRHNIECQAHRTGLLFAAHYEGAVSSMRARAEDLAGRGGDVHYLGRDETAKKVGSDFYPGAMLDLRAGSIDPLAYVQGFAKAAQNLGARLFIQTSANKISRDGDGWLVSTAEGSVRARNVAICTNAYSSETLWPGLARSFVPARAYQSVSRPLSENLRRSILPEHQALTDSRRLFSAIRVLADGRVHVTSYGPPFSLTGEPYTTLSDKRVLSLFPQLETIEWEGGWSGWVAINQEQEPKLFQLDKGVWAVTGYSGRGLAFATLMGRQIALRISQPESHDIVYPASPLRPLLGQQFGPLFIGAYFKLAAFLDARELKQTEARASNSRTIV